MILKHSFKAKVNLAVNMSIPSFLRWEDWHSVQELTDLLLFSEAGGKLRQDLWADNKDNGLKANGSFFH